MKSELEEMRTNEAKQKAETKVSGAPQNIMEKKKNQSFDSDNMKSFEENDEIKNTIENVKRRSTSH